jgi:hypothetical protein
MHCQEFEEYTNRFPEQEPPAGSPAAAHLRNCPRCAARMADLEEIIRTAASLPAFDPPERVWIALRARLEEEGMLRRQAGLLERLGLERPAAPLPTLATAALCALAALLLFLPSRFTGPERGGFPAGGEQASVWSFPRIHQQLASTEAEENRDLGLRDPEVVASYQQNLALVDNLIGVCQKSVDDNPDDEMARDYLLTAYQQKADLLSALSERGALGD